MKRTVRIDGWLACNHPRIVGVFTNAGAPLTSQFKIVHTLAVAGAKLGVAARKIDFRTRKNGATNCDEHCAHIGRWNQLWNDLGSILERVSGNQWNRSLNVYRDAT